MSALQAVEQWIDRMVAGGAAIEDVTATLFEGCENLAVPSLVVGATIRHLGDDPRLLDRYLVEPLIWQFEQLRVTHEGISFMRAADDGITNPERRKWYLRDISALLVLKADTKRRAELKNLGERLIANTARFDASESTVRRWAATLDAENVMTEAVRGGVLVSVKEPDDIEEELAPMRADMARGKILLALQNKYWIPARQQAHGWTPPTPGEIADDLAQVKDLHDNPPGFAASDPHLTLAHVAAAAVGSAVAGHPEAFGRNAPFAIASLLQILNQAAADAAHSGDAHRYEQDIGTRAAAAGALPRLLLPELADHLAAAGVTPEDVTAAAGALGSLAATGTCLRFARGCDDVWGHACSGTPCIHLTAYQWALDLAQLCEIGEYDDELQESPEVVITGDLIFRIPQIRPERLDTSRLSATIRALGRAASSDACIAQRA